MALWGNKDNVTSAGTVSLNYSTGVVTGNASCKFGDAGSAQEGDVIRFTKGANYYGDAVIKTITSNTSLTIGSTAGIFFVSFGNVLYLFDLILSFNLNTH